MSKHSYDTTIITSFQDINPEAWNTLQGADHPFLRHEFFLTLENNGNLNHDSGWDCRIVCLFDHANDKNKNGTGLLIAAMPMFSKNHSWAEFVFDWTWANAYAQQGMEYYPKLVVTTPYTPAPARKCLTHPVYDKDELSERLIKAALDYAQVQGISSLHALFLNEEENALWQAQGLMQRVDCQFHWQNDCLGEIEKFEPDFDDFLASMSSSKRKKIRQERRSLDKQGVIFKIQTADQVDISLWPDLYQCYSNTFLLRGQPPYFSEALFIGLAKSMGEQMPIIQAWHGDVLVAAAICFQSESVLYGRYWGKRAEINNLHFETCYYQGIEYALANGLQHFEPGTGGTHKLRRGFQPTITKSMHWIKHEGFKTAIDGHLKQETKGVLAYAENMREHLPFKKISPSYK